MSTTFMTQTTGWMDRFGGLASLTCAVHCGLLAFAPAALTLLGLEVLEAEVLEWAFFAFALCFAGLAAALGFRTHHNFWVMGAFVAGIGLLVVARLTEALSVFDGGPVLAILGGLVLVGSHLVNTAQIKACQQPCCD
ncbi:MAG: MerC domain-containing protein [Myxococcota bacterium]